MEGRQIIQKHETMSKTEMFPTITGYLKIPEYSVLSPFALACVVSSMPFFSAHVSLACSARTVIIKTKLLSDVELIHCSRSLIHILRVLYDNIIK